MKIQPISAMFKSTNDTRRDGTPLTKERVLEYIKLYESQDSSESSTIVDLNASSLPAFLYNKDGKIK